MNGKSSKSEPKAPGRLALAAMGMEAEFSLMLDDAPTRPEDLFGSPRDFIRGELMHRQGTSYHLPTGSAVYFDTGVIEVATPVFELERGCGARATRSLWEAIQFIRGELDAWDAREGRETRLVGFSAHYNVSFELPRGEPANGRSIEKLALLLAYILPAPMMLLATNRQSTGVGVRPRIDRIEITSDFTPDPPLMIAAATLIVAVVREVMTWPSYELTELEAHGIPVIRDFRPMPHTSRKGWLARFDCYAANPFTCNVDSDTWPTQSHGDLSLREVAARIVHRFRRAMEEVSDPDTLQLIHGVMRGSARSMLDMDERPAAYEDVGRLCAWEERLEVSRLGRSVYETIVHLAVSGRELSRGDAQLRPVGMDGWSAIAFLRADGEREVIALDDLIEHIDDWKNT